MKTQKTYKTYKKRKKSCFEEHTHSQCVSEAMEKAEAFCREKGLRLTALRRSVLETVWEAQKPLNAYDILSLQKDLSDTAPICVYRALDFLADNGLVHRLNKMFVACRFIGEEHVSMVLVCSDCSKTEEIKTDRLFKEFKKLCEGHKFKPDAMTVEIKGVCPSCRTRKKR